MDPSTVDRDFELVRRVLSFESTVAIVHRAEQRTGEQIFPVHREVITHQGAAAFPQRKAFDMPVLAVGTTRRHDKSCGTEAL